MTVSLIVTDDLVEVNRALESLRDAATKAYVNARRVADVHGHDPEWQKLALRIDALRMKLYESEIDGEIIALVGKSALLAVQQP